MLDLEIQVQIKTHIQCMRIYHNVKQAQINVIPFVVYSEIQRQKYIFVNNVTSNRFISLLVICLCACFKIMFFQVLQSEVLMQLRDDDVPF